MSEEELIVEPEPTVEVAAPTEPPAPPTDAVQGSEPEYIHYTFALTPEQNTQLQTLFPVLQVDSIAEVLRKGLGLALLISDIKEQGQKLAVIRHAPEEPIEVLEILSFDPPPAVPTSNEG